MGRPSRLRALNGRRCISLSDECDESPFHGSWFRYCFWRTWLRFLWCRIVHHAPVNDFNLCPQNCSWLPHFLVKLYEVIEIVFEGFVLSLHIPVTWRWLGYKSCIEICLAWLKIIWTLDGFSHSFQRLPDISRPVQPLPRGSPASPCMAPRFPYTAKAVSIYGGHLFTWWVKVQVLYIFAAISRISRCEAVPSSCCRYYWPKK